jgi:D-glycero-alpha-D-manno-heptose-7-phosphate kinase
LEIDAASRDAASCAFIPRMTAVIARAPTRIDFGGGWTDVPPYCDEEGGFVCNLAIARYATVRLERRRDGNDEAGSAAEEELAQAALRIAALPGVQARIDSDFPVKAGLGGSSAAGVAMMGAIEAFRALEAIPSDAPERQALRDAIPLDRAAVAEASRRVEVEELHVAGGFQDHYAAAFGGALALSFGGGTRVHRLSMQRQTVRELEARCTVVYTGHSRISGDTIRAVLDGWAAREGRVVTALSHMRELARGMADSLVSGDLDTLGTLVGEHWTHQRALHPSITTPRIDEILERARQAGALGGKALGASGGGCVLVVAARGLEVPVRRAVEALGEPLAYRVDQQGLAWWTDDAPAPSHPSPMHNS